MTDEESPPPPPPGVIARLRARAGSARAALGRSTASSAAEVRRIYSLAESHEAELLAALRSDERARRAAQRADRRRQRRVTAHVLSAIGRFAALPLSLFPIALVAGWLYHAGRILGLGLPLALVPPDPGKLLVDAASLTLLVIVSVAVIGGVWIRISRASFRRRVVVGAGAWLVAVASIVASIGGVPLEWVAVTAFAVMVATLATSIIRSIATGREVTALFVLVALLAPLPFGYIGGLADLRNARGDRITFSTGSTITGLTGTSTLDGCVYDDVLLLHADQARLLVRSDDGRTVILIPQDRVVSMSIGPSPAQASPAAGSC